MTSSITFAESEATATISYKALNFAEGKFVERMKDANFRQFMNAQAKQQGLGSLSLPADMNIGGTDVAAGDYGVHFFASDEGHPILTLSKDGELIQWTLDNLQSNETMRPRLVLNFVPAAKANEVDLHLHFGNLSLDIPVKPVVKEDDGEKEEV